MAQNIVKNDFAIKREGFHYIIKNEEISFFYNDILFLRHTKFNPSFSIMIEKNGVEKEIPLFNFNIHLKEKNKYLLDFFYKGFLLKVEISFVNNQLEMYMMGWDITHKIKVCLYKREEEILSGFGLNNLGAMENCVIGNMTEIKDKKHKNNEYKPAFYLKNKYLMTADGVIRFETKIGNTIEFVAKGKEMKLFFQFGKDKKDILTRYRENTYEGGAKKSLLKKSEIIKKCYFLEVAKVVNNTKNLKGVVLLDEGMKTADLINVKSYLKSRNIAVIVRYQPKIEVSKALEQRLSQDIFILTEDGVPMRKKEGKKEFFYYDILTENAQRIVKNEIRDILDYNVDGLFLGSAFIPLKEWDAMEKMEERETLFQTTVHKLASEYPDRVLIFENLTCATERCGYYQTFEKAVKKEREIFLQNLEASGVTRILVDKKGNLSQAKTL